MSKDTSNPFDAVARGRSEVLGTSRASAVRFARSESGNDEVLVLGASTRVSAEGNTVKFSNAVMEINGERLIELSPKPKSGKSRNKWLEIDKVEEMHGVSITTHPFLNDKNLKDKVILKYCIAEQPFTAPYGQDMKAWQKLAKLVNEEKDEDGTRIFEPPVTGQALKDRFKRYMKYATESSNAVSRRSGCDDEAPPSEVQTLVEALSEMYKSFRSTKEEAKQSIASLKEGKEAAEIMRCASMASIGQTPAAAEKSVSKLCRSGAGPEKAKKGMNPGGYTDSLVVIKEQIRSREEIFDKKQESTEKGRALRTEQFERRLEFKKLQFQKNSQMKKRKLAIVKQKWEMEKAERAANIETQQIMTKCLAAVLAKMVENDGDNKK